MPEQQPSLDQPTDQPSAEPSIETMPSLQEMLKRAELQAQEHYDAWLRAKAECDNVRKRAQTDVANAHKYALETFSSQLLPVRDSLEAALATENSTLEALRQGVELTLKQLDAAFDKSAIREINPLSEKFDPHKHQAMTTVDSDKPANTVVHVLQKGYQLHDRVLRPALVTVSKAKPNSDA
jgi:molecular chaperone GrpE